MITTAPHPSYRNRVLATYHREDGSSFCVVFRRSKQTETEEGLRTLLAGIAEAFPNSCHF